MKHLLILGATSGIGRQALDEALTKNHRVRAFARGAEMLGPRSNLEPFAGDALVKSDVARALDGVDAVIYTLGIKESLAMPFRKVTLFSRSTRILLDEMHRIGPRRLIAVTGLGAGRSKSALSAAERLGHFAFLGRPYADKDLQETMIVQSGLDWTIARPTILTNTARTGRYQLLRQQGAWRNGLISRADVAHYLIGAVDSPEDIGADVVLAR